jgi:hypothetical protein
VGVVEHEAQQFGVGRAVVVRSREGTPSPFP